MKTVECVCGHMEHEHAPTGEDVREPRTGRLVPGERCVDGCACECFDEWAGEHCACGMRAPFRLYDKCDRCYWDRKRSAP